MEWRLFANLREVAGTSRVTIPDDTRTAEAALEELFAQYPELRSQVLEEDGTLGEHINVLRNGTAVENLSCELNSDDELALFPPVSGG